MNQEKFLWPYEEAKIEFTSNGIEWTSPWVKARYSQTLDTLQQDRVASLLANGPKSLNDLQYMTSFCESFDKQPLFYRLPRAYLPRDEVITLKPIPLVQNTDWDLQAALDFSQVAAGWHDPQSLLSVMRVFFFRSRIISSNQSRIFEAISSLPEELRKEKLAFLVRQNHYVTERCLETLKPAVHLHSPSSELIENFINEEGGHDKILKRALESLNQDPDAIPVVESLIKLMAEFKNAAQTNLIAFAFYVDVFERSPKKSPIANALIELGESQAAKHLQIHSDINVDGDHAGEAFKLLSMLGAIPTAYAIQAVQMGEQAFKHLENYVKERNEMIG